MLLLFIFTNLLWASEEIKPSKNFVLSGESFFTTQNFKKTPIDFDANDYAPPSIALMLTGKQDNKSFDWLYDLGYAKNSKAFRSIFLMAGAQREFWKDITLGIKLYAIQLNENSDLGGTIFNSHITGYQIFGSYLYQDYLFGVLLDTGLASDATIDSKESQKTKLHHAATDSKFALSVLKPIQQYKLYAELATYSFSEVYILSKSFSYTIETDRIQKYILGGGYVYKQYEFWLKYHQFSNPSDDLSYFYQNPRFYPDYMLAKEYLSVEVKWKI